MARRRETVRPLLLESPDCTLEYTYVYTTIVQLDQLCACLDPEAQESLKNLAYVHIMLSLFGVVVLLLSLVVSSTMITKSSTAVLLSILLLYNLLRLAAVGLLASFTLISRRDMAQRVANAVWLLGTWGVHYTLVDLAVEPVLVIFRPDLIQMYATPVRAVKRTFLLLVLGLLACSAAIAQAIAKTRTTEEFEIPYTCERSQYYYAYWKWYQTSLVTMVWVLPIGVMVVVFLMLLFHLLQKNLCESGNGLHFRSHHVPADISHQQRFITCLLGWYVVVNVPYASSLLMIQITSSYIRFVDMLELSVLIATVTSPFVLFLWPWYREEASKTMMCHAGIVSTPASSTHSRSLPSFFSSY